MLALFCKKKKKKQGVTSAGRVRVVFPLWCVCNRLMGFHSMDPLKPTNLCGWIEIELIF